MIFGTDKSAGDREIAFFAAAASAGKATSSTVIQHEAVPKMALTRGMTLRAVPLHAGDSSQRYNPYHLRVICREMDADLESLGGERSVHNRFGGVHPEDSNETGDSTIKAGYDRGQTGVEVAAFHDSGVVYVNVHGETSFQSIEDWSREKERHGKISQMTFCRWCGPL